MHMNRRTADIDDAGHCRIYFKSFLPYNLYLEEKEDIDSLVNNITDFHYWCASRALTLDRKYAKEIGLNQIKEVEQEVFADRPQYYEMFAQRLELLKTVAGV